jgi:hypothetical protein
MTISKQEASKDPQLSPGIRGLEIVLVFVLVVFLEDRGGGPEWRLPFPQLFCCHDQRFNESRILDMKGMDEADRDRRFAAPDSHFSTIDNQPHPENMASQKQRAAAKTNIKKAAAAAKRKETISHLPKKTRAALGEEGAKAARKKHPG